MTGVNHALTGIAIAVLVQRPEVAVPLALLSHFVLDMIPHGVVEVYKRRQFRNYLILEALCMTIITLIAMGAFAHIWFLVGLCAVLAFAPDMLWPFQLNGKLANAPGFRQFYWFHKRIQWSETKRGFVVEGLYAFVLVIFLLQAAGAVQ